MNRRRFVQSASVAGLGLLAGCGRLPFQAQPSKPPPRIGYLAVGTAGPYDDAFRLGLADYGYTDGQNIVIDYRWADNPGQLPGLAAAIR